MENLLGEFSSWDKLRDFLNFVHSNFPDFGPKLLSGLVEFTFCARNEMDERNIRPNISFEEAIFMRGK